MIIDFLQSEGKSTDIQILLFKKLKVIKVRLFVNVLKVGNVFHQVLLKYLRPYVEHPATPA